jgi:hypothetical protein
LVKSNLLEIFRKFSPKELKEFGEYVRSPFFNKNQSIVKLYEYLKKQFPEFDEKKVEKETVYLKLFQGTKYNDGFMRTIMFNLAQLAEDYIAFCNYKNDKYSVKRHMAVEFNNRDLRKLFEKNIKEINSMLDKVSVKDGDFYYNRFYIEYENLYYLSKLHFDKSEKFIYKTGVHNIFNHITYFYLIRVLKFYLYILNTKNIYKVDYKTNIIEDILKGFNPVLFEDVPLVNIYYNLLMLYLKEDDESYFYKLKKIAGQLDHIPYEEKVEIYINMENYCKRKIRYGDKKFTGELFEIYQQELDNKSYTIMGIMPHKLYKNIVDTALKLNEFDWTEKFIEDYKKELADEHKENTYLYCRGIIEFYSGNFEKALEILAKVKYDEIYHKAEMKCMIMAIYYELNIEDTLLASLDSFRHFLSNDKIIPEDRKLNYFNFLRFLKKLNNAKNGNNINKGDIKMLKDNIENHEHLHSKDWLIAKVCEML